MVACAVYGCTHRSVRDMCSFYRFPKVRRTFSPELKALAEERRSLWVLRMGRSDLNDVKIENARVCGDHFVTGAPAALKDVSHVDWAPTLKLGHMFFESDVKRHREVRTEVSQYNVTTNTLTFKNIFEVKDDFANEDSMLIGNEPESTSSDMSDNELFTAEDSVSQNVDDSQPPHETSGDKLKYFIYDSNKSSDSEEDVCTVTHERALKSAKTLLRYMMNQDDVCQADITLVVNYIKKISDKL